MARVFLTASPGNHLITGSTPVNSYPISMACWIKPTATSSGMIMGIMADVANDNGPWMFKVNADFLVNASDDDVAGTSSTPTPTFTNGVLSHVAGTWTNDPTHQGWVDGTAGTEQTDTKTTFTATPTDIMIGAEVHAGAANAPSAHISWPCVWNVKLTDTEIGSLAAGAHPYTVRPGSIVAFWGDLHSTGNEIDLTGGGYDLVEAGTLANAESPLLWMPTPPIYTRGASGAMLLRMTQQRLYASG